jgi:hypothetical protein
VFVNVNAKTNLEIINASKLKKRNNPNLTPNCIPTDSNNIPTTIIDANTDIAPIIAVLMMSLL